MLATIAKELRRELTAPTNASRRFEQDLNLNCISFSSMKMANSARCLRMAQEMVMIHGSDLVCFATLLSILGLNCY
ncbi:hypothetical protein GCK32_020424 [Trichostrongylus colubriformis]|uniref:Uncharacterized protein n=1 Tax=Trichostrongylus colubriformis TaxID=6319 RepID=A0AAN8IZ20_TRICO